MADQPTRGITDASKLSGIDAALEAIAKSSGPDAIKAFAEYRKALERQLEQTKRAKGEIAKFADYMKNLSKDAGALGKTFEYVGEQAAREQGLLTASLEAEYLEKRKFIDLAKEHFKAQGIETKAQFAAMATISRQLEEENMNQRLNTTIAYGKASETLKGMGVSMVASLQKSGRMIATTTGDILGLTGAQMASLASWGALAAGVIYAFKNALETTVRSARDATESGLELSSGIQNLAGRYMTAVREATTFGYVVQVLDPEKFKAAWKKASSEFLYDVGLTTSGYQNLQAMTKEQRTEARLQAANYLAEAMLVGKAYGIQEEEAVKLSTAMGRMSYTTIRNQTQAMRVVNEQFMVMAETAQALGIPIQMLVGSMEDLTKITWGLNLPVETLTSQTIGLYESMQGLGRAGVFGFVNMRAEQTQQAVQNLIKSLSSIDLRRQMALTQTPGGTWGQALERVIKDPLGALDATISRAAKLMGTGLTRTMSDEEFRRKPVEAFVRLAKGLGLSGNERELYAAGAEVFQAWRENRLDATTIKTISAKMVDERFNQAKSVGQNIAQGADVLQVIAGTLMNLLKVVVEAVNNMSSWLGRGSVTARDLAAEFREQRYYGDIAFGGRRWVRT